MATDEISVSRGDLVELISSKASEKSRYVVGTPNIINNGPFEQSITFFRCFVRMFDSGDSPKEGWVPIDILEFNPTMSSSNGKESGDAEFRKL